MKSNIIRKKIFIVALVTITSLFSACCDKPRVIVKTEYVKAKCPRLQTYDINKTVIAPLQLQYKVVKDDK